MSRLTRRQFSKTAAAAVAALSFDSIQFSTAQPRGDTDLDQLANLTLTEAAQCIRSGSVTSTQLTQACLERIRIYNPKVFAFITVLGEYALTKAAQLDAEARAGKFRGPLHGIPIALKDNIDTA